LQIDSFNWVFGRTAYETRRLRAEVGEMTQLVILKVEIFGDFEARRGGSAVKSGDSETGERRWESWPHAGMILTAPERGRTSNGKSEIEGSLHSTLLRSFKAKIYVEISWKVFKNPTGMSCRTGPLRAGRQLRCGQRPSAGAPVGRERSLVADQREAQAKQ
jgi:hypothetical protein